MQNVVTIGRRLVPVEHIALVESFDPAKNPQFQPERAFKARVVLLNRDTVLTEQTPKEFADAHGFRMLAEDNVATNPALTFRIETFEPTDTFRPAAPYLTRLKWRDHDGNEQSKLLLAKPETVIAIALRGEVEPGPDRQTLPRRPTSRRTQRRRTAPSAET
jgi:hypothetical protein